MLNDGPVGSRLAFDGHSVKPRKREKTTEKERWRERERERERETQRERERERERLHLRLEWKRKEMGKQLNPGVGVQESKEQNRGEEKGLVDNWPAQP